MAGLDFHPNECRRKRGLNSHLWAAAFGIRKSLHADGLEDGAQGPVARELAPKDALERDAGR